MYTISRREQFTIYYWTGSNWTTDKAKAKKFAIRQEAERELFAKDIHYTCNITAD